MKKNNCYYDPISTKLGKMMAKLKMLDDIRGNNDKFHEFSRFPLPPNFKISKYPNTPNLTPPARRTRRDRRDPTTGHEIISSCLTENENSRLLNLRGDETRSLLFTCKKFFNIRRTFSYFLLTFALNFIT